MGGDPPGRRHPADPGSLNTAAAHRVPNGADDALGIRVIPDIPAVTRRFDYTVPSEWRARVRVGSRVRVRMHGRGVGAWVSDLETRSPEGVVAAPVAAWRGHGPPASLVALAEWAAWRFSGPVTAFLRAASPDRIVSELPGPPPVLAVPQGDAIPCPEPGLLSVGPTEDLLPFLLGVLGRIEAASAPGTVLVLVPSRGWAERLSERLRSRGIAVARSWEEAAAGWPVIVGTRQAAWAPAASLGAAVILDAHDERYHEERAPTATAWEVVAERAKRDGAPCWVVSSCPTAELEGRFGAVTKIESGHGQGWPSLHIVDRRGADPRTGGYSEEFVFWGRQILLRGDRLVCVLNRTGRARLLACAGCDTLARCEVCGHAVGLASDEATATDLFRCPSCATTRPVVCSACGRTRMKLLRIGVARAREELEALFGVPVAEIAGPAAPIPESDAAPVLIGTEAVLHRVRRSGGVAFLDIDQHLLAPRFRAAEETLALFVHAGRMVGGRKESHSGTGEGGVLVQTRMPDHPVLLAVDAGDPSVILASERDMRAQLHLPPAAALAVVSGDGAATYCAALDAEEVDVSDTGTRGRWLVRAGDHETLCNALADVERPAGRFRVAVDPLDL